MSASNKILQAAAGNAGEESVYVEDVFSTYLYEGTGAAQTIENGIALGDTNYGSSVEFDGVGDYLSRSSGLSSHADSNTFTLSIWVFNKTPSGFARVFGIKNSSGSNNVLYLQISSSNALSLATLTDGASTIQAIDDSQGYTVPANQWSHILVSANTSTSTWHLSINDSYSSVTPQKPLGYTDAVAFSTSSGSTVGTLYGGYFKGRITQLYLDNTFRDLSQTSVRRTFITSDGTPATGLSSLSPILYLPLDDTNSIGTNSGTGGAYTVNGSPTQLSEGGPYEESGFGKGGMLWIKDRDAASNGYITDTERSLAYLRTNSSSAEVAHTATYDVTALNSNGFSVGLTNEGVNTNGNSNVSWSFRKQAGFFDIQTWTGNGTAGRTVSHNLGSVPGCIIVKSTSTTGNWMVYHRGIASDAETDVIRLNLTNAAVDTALTWNDTAPTSTEFTLGTSSDTNNSGTTYVAYLFAHDDQSFGDNSDESIIKCGSYTGNNTAGNTITLGWEPQWILVKNATTGGTADDGWWMVDNMRGWTVGNDKTLQANTSSAEDTYSRIDLTATGFSLTTGGEFNQSGDTYIYIAIRRPMKTPEAGTEVFTPIARTGTGAVAQVNAGFAVDLSISSERGTVFVGDKLFFDKLRGANARLTSTGTAAESSSATDMLTAFTNTGVTLGADANWYINKSGNTYINWMFKRATGFFDVVAYTGDGSGAKSFNHNLGVIPELMIVKGRNYADSWYVYVGSLGSSNRLKLESTTASGSAGTLWNSTSPTATQFTVGSGLNASSETNIVYLFATLAGISKVGSYTGTGSSQTIDCGFSSGARFVLIKKTSSTGNWLVFDTARGITVGSTDGTLTLDTTTQEYSESVFFSNDVIQPDSSGFKVLSSASLINDSGASYIFLAIA